MKIWLIAPKISDDLIAKLNLIEFYKDDPLLDSECNVN